MISADKKKRIESLSPEEMLYEINLGRKSRFQRESFAYLQTCYQQLIESGKLENSTQYPANLKTNDQPDNKSSCLIRIAEGVFIGVLVLFVAWVFFHYLGIEL